MYSRKFGVQGMISAVIAFAILGIAALVLDHGHLLAAPAGVVEVDQLTPVETLDPVTVVARQ